MVLYMMDSNMPDEGHRQNIIFKNYDDNEHQHTDEYGMYLIEQVLPEVSPKWLIKATIKLDAEEVGTLTC